MFCSALRTIAVGLALVGATGFATAGTYDLGTLNNTVAESGIEINGSFDDVFKVVDAETKFQKVTIASEAKEANPDFYQKLHEWAKLNGVEVVEVPHEQFKKLSASSVAIVRTGECKPFSNVILESNVSF